TSSCIARQRYCPCIRRWWFWYRNLRNRPKLARRQIVIAWQNIPSMGYLRCFFANCSGTLLSLSFRRPLSFLRWLREELDCERFPARIVYVPKLSPKTFFPIWVYVIH